MTRSGSENESDDDNRVTTRDLTRAMNPGGRHRGARHNRGRTKRAAQVEDVNVEVEDGHRVFDNDAYDDASAAADDDDDDDDDESIDLDPSSNPFVLHPATRFRQAWDALQVELRVNHNTIVCQYNSYRSCTQRHCIVRSAY